MLSMNVIIHIIYILSFFKQGREKKKKKKKKKSLYSYEI